MTRDADGAVHLLLNRCAHRGNQVCDDDRGNARSFRCPTTAGPTATPASWSASRSTRATAARARSSASSRLARVPRVDSHQRLRVRQLRRGRAQPGRASGRGGRRARPAGPAVTGRQGRAHRGLAAAPHPGQLEAAGRERDRRLPPAVRARLDLQRYAAARSARSTATTRRRSPGTWATGTARTTCDPSSASSASPCAGSAPPRRECPTMSRRCASAYGEARRADPDRGRPARDDLPEPVRGRDPGLRHPAGRPRASACSTRPRCSWRARRS